MPGPLVAALAAPIREVRSMVGPGWSSDPGGDPAVVLADVRDALADAATTADRVWRQADAHWRGAGAHGAAEFATATAAAADALAHRADRLSTGSQAAGAAVARADARLQAIVDRFETRAAAMEPHLDEPGVVEELLAEAQRALADAVVVVDELRAELDGQAGALTTPAAASAPAPTAPAGFAGTPGMGSAGGSAPSSPLPGLGAPPSSGSGLADIGAFTPSPPEAAVPLPDPGTFGDGVAVRLPDGSTVMAPNAVAASAVRHALTQLGVPYHWGGTTPGVGLDCSGLTQWAYREAGLDIPRLAQEQDVGAAVNPGSLRAGDLAVWDGHVAMIVGNGMMIEAGDPVQLSPVRTTNAGQGFHGFFRPTA